jgi:hypothetical protein
MAKFHIYCFIIIPPFSNILKEQKAWHANWLLCFEYVPMDMSDSIIRYMNIRKEKHRREQKLE